MTKEKAVTTTPKTNEIVQQDNQVNNLITQALEKGADIEVMERLFILQEKWEANQAKKAFDLAMANFQGECPVIKKKSPVHDNTGKHLYSYAKLESIVEQVKPFLSKNGLSYTFKPSEVDGKMTTICIAKHIAGHNEESEMTVQRGQGTSIQSASQVAGGDITFSKRYAFCNVFGIMTGNEDNDAQQVDAPAPLDITKQKAEIDKCKTMKQISALYKKYSPEEQANQELINYANDKIKEIKEDIPVIKSDNQ